MIFGHRRSSSQPVKRPGKQIALLLITAMISFAIGMTVGRNTAPVPHVVKVKVPIERADPAAEKLTFYNTLPKGEVPALGSGINLPAPETPPSAVSAPATPAPPPPAPQPAAVAAPAPAQPAPVPPPAPPVAAAKPAPAPAKGTAKPHPPAKGERWVVQTASYPREEDARTMSAKLWKRGYKTRIEEAEIRGKTWYRVFVGPYPSEKAARQAASSLRSQENLAAIVRKG